DESAATAVLPTEEDWLARAEEFPQDPVTRQQAADIQLRRGDRAAAIQHLLSAADVYMSQGFAVKAMAVLAQVLAVDPDNDDVPSRIAHITRDDAAPPVESGVDLTIRTRLRAWTPLFSDFSRAD